MHPDAGTPVPAPVLAPADGAAGPGWETPLLDAYGIAPDPERTRCYRLLWDLGP